MKISVCLVLVLKSDLGDLVPDMPRILHIAKKKLTFLDIFRFRIFSFGFDGSKRAESNVGIELVLLEPKNFF